ncbi:MAG: hypothetical protein HYV07_17700 [Deltaproteobacteria bacterium]|nr:hypothetical protein [Deltaproteobacteria bacterium]
MDSPALVTDQISSGATVLERLEEAHISVRAALWSYNVEAGEWRYVVATSLADVEGPRALYERIQRALHRSEATKDFPFWRIEVLSPKSELISTLKRLLGKIENPSGLSFAIQGGTPYDTNILVYRLR